MVALAESCITKYGESVLGTIINADVCPHYFFAGVMMGLIDADVSFCKDPQEVERVKKFLKEHVSKDERQRAKAVKLIDRTESDPCTIESELLEVHNACEATA